MTRSEIPNKVPRRRGRGRKLFRSSRSFGALARAGFARVTDKLIRLVQLLLTRIRYRFSPLSSGADTVFFVRIIGNDLEPRHKKGQAYENVEFILNNEPEFPNWKKYWVLNRIIDPEAQLRLIDLLESHRQKYTIIPFESAVYQSLDWDLGKACCGEYRFTPEYKCLDEHGRLRFESAIRRSKNLYIMNNNGARNLALSIGRSRAKWVLPWDGNCFLTQMAFEQIYAGIRKYSYVPYLVVPMARIEDNQALLQGSFSAAANEEPQIIFRTDAQEAFREEIPYGRRPKVDLLWRLGVPGVWNRYGQDPWDIPRPPLSSNRGLYKEVGWVARLASGRPELEVGRKSSARRGMQRDKAIKRTIDRADQHVVETSLIPQMMMFYDEVAIAKLGSNVSDPTRTIIQGEAELALRRGPFGVLDKSMTAPSGDPHDYYHPAPFRWPNPSSEAGLPFIRTDGEQVPEPKLYGLESDKYHGIRLQLLFDDTLNLALAWRVFGDIRYAEHGAKLVRTWFIDERTRMSPHMTYAQLRADHDNKGTGASLLDFKDVYYFLDAVRLIEISGVMSPADVRALSDWFRSYANWLDTDPVGICGFQATNSHGVFFDLQRAAIAAYLGDASTLNRVRLHSRERLHGQIAADGSLPEELGRIRPMHNVFFTLQGWTALARLMSNVGDDLWGYRTVDGRGIGLALDWVNNLAASREWPASTIDEVEMKRLAPLMQDRANHYTKEPTSFRSHPLKMISHPETAIAPYWNLWQR